MNATVEQVKDQIDLMPISIQLQIERAKVAALLIDRDEMVQKNITLTAEISVHDNFIKAAFRYCGACTAINIAPSRTDMSYITDNRLDTHQKMIKQFKQLINGETLCLFQK